MRRLTAKELKEVLPADGKLYPKVKVKLLSLGLVSIHNVEIDGLFYDELKPSEVILPAPLYDKLVEAIIEVSLPDSDYMTNLIDTISLVLSKEVQTNDCSTCTARDMSVRRCSKEGNDYGKHNKPLLVNGKEYWKCPTGYVDFELWGEAYEAYSVMDSGFLPLQGGFYDQTDFFCKNAMLVKRKLKEKEAKEIEEMKQKSKAKGKG